MLAQKIDILTTIEATLSAQIKAVKAEKKAKLAKLAKLASYWELQAELLQDSDTTDTITGATSVSTPTPRIIPIFGVEDLPQLRVIEIDWEVAHATVTPPPTTDTITEAVDPLRAEIMTRSDNLLKALGIKTKEARQMTEVNFGSGKVSRLHLDNAELEHFVRILEIEHSQQQATKASVIKSDLAIKIMIVMQSHFRELQQFDQLQGIEKPSAVLNLDEARKIPPIITKMKNNNSPNSTLIEEFANFRQRTCAIASTDGEYLAIFRSPQLSLKKPFSNKKEEPGVFVAKCSSRLLPSA